MAQSGDSTYPCVDTALGEQAAVHFLPANSIMLNYRLIGDPESTSGGKAPVRGVKSYRGLLESLACAAQCKKTARREVRKDEDKYVEWKVGYGRLFVRHRGSCGWLWKCV